MINVRIQAERVCSFDGNVLNKALQSFFYGGIIGDDPDLEHVQKTEKVAKVKRRAALNATFLEGLGSRAVGQTELRVGLN